MKVTKSAIYRIAVTAPCTCQVLREYEDARFTKPVGKAATFVACKKHKDKADIVDMMEMLLTSRLEEAAKENPAPPVLRQSAELIADPGTGETVTRMPMPANHRPPGGARLTPKTTNMAGRGAGAGKVSASAILQEKEIELSSGNTAAMDAELAGADIGVSLSAENIAVAKEEGADANLLDVLLANADSRERA